MKNYSFRIIIEPDEKNTFHGYVPSLRGCHTWGKTFEETRQNLQDAIRAYILSLIDDGEPIPQERGLEAMETVSINSSKRSPTRV
jgi:predicted RNase H-like HicB family nuclease